MKEKIMAVIFIIIMILSIFAIGYRVAEMKYTGQDIITVYNQD
jgi:hypothetical protein